MDLAHRYISFRIVPMHFMRMNGPQRMCAKWRWRSLRRGRSCRTWLLLWWIIPIWRMRSGWKKRNIRVSSWPDRWVRCSRRENRADARTLNSWWILRLRDVGTAVWMVSNGQSPQCSVVSVLRQRYHRSAWNWHRRCGMRIHCWLWPCMWKIMELRQ